MLLFFNMYQRFVSLKQLFLHDLNCQAVSKQVAGDLLGSLTKVSTL